MSAIITLKSFLFTSPNQFECIFLESPAVASGGHCSRALGLQEATYLQREGDAASTYECFKSLE
jgi:hypothetical protein